MRCNPIYAQSFTYIVDDAANVSFYMDFGHRVDTHRRLRHHADSHHECYFIALKILLQ